MKTYINKSIKGYFVTYPGEIDSEYWAGLIGATYEDFLNGKWVLLTEELTQFHEEYPTASVSEVLNMEFEVETPTLEDIKNEKLLQLYEYDSSDAVNEFIVNGVGGWFTAAERANFRASIDSAKLLDINTLSFFVGDLEITIPTQLAEVFLALIQNYADECFLITKRHELNIKALDSILEVTLYLSNSGYPPKLTFTIE